MQKKKTHNKHPVFLLSVGGRNCHIETSAGLQREASGWAEAQAGHVDVKWAETEPKQELERRSVKHSVSKLLLIDTVLLQSPIKEYPANN